MRILFSTTVGHNPGDEIVFRGVRSLLEAAGIRYEPRIYDRNPAKYGCRAWWGREQRRLLASLDGSIDHVVFAGTPEWCSEIPNLSDLLRGPKNPRFIGRILGLRVSDRIVDPLLSFLIRNGLRCSFVGVGSSKRPVVTHKIDYILRNRTDAFIVRDPQTFEVFSAYGPQLKPCPGLFAAGSARLRTQRARVGVVLQAPRSSRIVLPTKSVAQALDLTSELESQGLQVSYVCHSMKDALYIKRHSSVTTIDVPTTAAQMLRTYDQFDVVFSMRLHGCITAASLGIPSFPLHSSYRMDSLRPLGIPGNRGASPMEWLTSLNVKSESGRLLALKRAAKKDYLRLLRHCGFHTE